MEEPPTRPLDTRGRESLYPEPGALVDGTYRIERLLGSGGYGVVMAATDETLERRVALKFLREAYASNDDRRERFLQEARAMARVHHPNVVGIHGVGQWNETPYLVMEFIEGQTLSGYIARRGGRLSVHDAMGLLEQACRGVVAIHAANTTHGDLKPANMLVGAPARLAITDFGLAEHAHAENRGGTIGHAAPELMSTRALSTRERALADVYSLGVLAWSLFCGEPPFAGTPDQVLERQLSGAPAFAEHSASSRLPPFGPIFDAVLSPDPDVRPSTVTELLTAFANAFTGWRRWTPVPRRVIVIEDDAVQRMWLMRAVEEVLPLSEVSCYEDAESALDELLSEPPDLLITDLRLPGIDGFGVVQRVRASDAAASVPILAITAAAEPVDWARLTELGADGFLPKPLKMTALRATAQRMLTRRA